MFKTIENTNYEISESGEVRRIYKNGNITILKPAITYNGYMYVNLYYINHGKRKKKTIHRLLAETFIPNDNPNYKIIDHIDRNRLNNSIDNLRWVNAEINANNSSKVINKKGCICETKDKVKGKIYTYFRAYWYENKKKKSKRFKTRQEATNHLQLIYP